MKEFRWSSDKDEWLKLNRGVGFEEVVAKLEKGEVIAAIEHPNASRYPNQKMFVVELRGYAFLIPYVETTEEIFLKTVIPSRRATRRYLSGGREA